MYYKNGAGTLRNLLTSGTNTCQSLTATNTIQAIYIKSNNGIIEILDSNSYKRWEIYPSIIYGRDQYNVTKITISSTGNINTSGNITCDDITCDDLTVDQILSASGKIEIGNSIQFTSGSYGIHFNNNTSNDVLYSSGSQLIFRNSSGVSYYIDMTAA